jgi:ABC-type uncharacterized transport system substrate-binding protein
LRPGHRGSLNQRLTAIYLDEIVKGVEPRQPGDRAAYRFGLVVNLKTAEALGIAILQGL